MFFCKLKVGKLLLGEVIAMRVRNLENLFLKHFDFLRKDYGFEYDASLNRYFKGNQEFQVQHEHGELKLWLSYNQKRVTIEEFMSSVENRDFTYPENFIPIVISMGDVDSRLAFDSKLVKEQMNKIST